MIQTDKNPYILLLISMIICIAVFIFFGYWMPDSPKVGHDGPTYLAVLSYLNSGRFPADFAQNPELFLRLQRFLEVVFALPFSFVFSGKLSIYLVNSLFFMLNGILLYKTYLLLFKESRGAFITALFYYFNIIPLHLGLTILSETGTHFFVLANTYFIIRYVFLNDDPQIKHFLVLGLLFALGFFMKESTLIVGFFFLLIMLYKWRKGMTLQRFIHGCGSTLVAFLVPVVLWQAFLFQRFHYGVLQEMQHHYSFKLKHLLISPLRIALSFGTAFTVLLIPYCVGLFKSKGQRYLLFALSLSGISFALLTLSFIDRFIFMMFPAIFLFSASYVFEENEFKGRYWFLGVYILLNLLLLVLYRWQPLYDHVYNLFKLGSGG